MTAWHLNKKSRADCYPAWLFHIRPDAFGKFFHHISKKKIPSLLKGFSKKGGDILSHRIAVPSAQAGLTSLFGMGRGEPRRNNHLRLFLSRRATCPSSLLTMCSAISWHTGIKN